MNSASASGKIIARAVAPASDAAVSVTGARHPPDATVHRTACRVQRPPPAMAPDVLLIRDDAGRNHVGPAEPLKLSRDVAVVQVGMITAVTADDLKRIRVASFRPACHYADGAA